MTISPINAASAAFLAGYEEASELIVGAPDPVLARLLLIEAERGRVPAAAYEEACRELGLCKRQVQRKLAALREAPGKVGRPGFTLTTHHEQVIMACQGNVALAHRQLCKEGEDLPDYTTFWRAWHCEPMAKQLYARKGAKGFMDFVLYPPWEAPERNAVWQADHFELPVDVIADGCTTTTVKPWLTLFEDDRSRKVMAWHLTAEVGAHGSLGQRGRVHGWHGDAARHPARVRLSRARLDLWFAEYDQTIHEGTGETPLARWKNDPTPLRRVPSTKLTSALLVAPQRYKVIRRKGIHFKGRYWMSNKLVDLTGRTVLEPACPAVRPSLSCALSPAERERCATPLERTSHSSKCS